MARKKIKIATLDRNFSVAVRVRDDWKCRWPDCEYCENYSFEHDPGNLHNSHFQKRRSRGTRWLPINCDAMCRGRHEFLEVNQHIYAEWKREQLGDSDFDELVLRANTPRKYTMRDWLDMNTHWLAQTRKMNNQRAKGTQGVLVLTPWD